jgi:hypothetical protein
MKNYNTEQGMYKYKKSTLTILILIIVAVAINGAVVLKWKPMLFENPGSKRLVKDSTGSYYFFRSQPEKTLLVNVKDLNSIEIRVVSKAKISNPQFSLIYENKQFKYDLKLLSVSEKFQVFAPVKVTLPAGLTQVELLCFDRNIYFRAFMPIEVKPKIRIPALKITSRTKEYDIAGPAASHKYYAFTESTAFAFQIRQGVAYTLYVRAQLTSKDKPVFGLYEDGKLVGKYEFPIRSTNTYKMDGVIHLTIGKKLDFPAQNKLTRYELKALSGHMFIARPVIRKVK